MRTAVGEVRRRFRIGNVAIDEFDLRHGTDTAGVVPLWKCRLESANARFGIKYQTLDEATLVETISATCRNPSDFTFVDMGCGKGKALLIATSMGFRNIVGVEFVPSLADTARRNLSKLAVPNATVVQGDASDYSFSDDDLVLYFFNPFSQEVMEKVVENLKKSSARNVYVVYFEPECAALLDASGFLRRVYLPNLGGKNVLVWHKQS